MKPNQRPLPPVHLAIVVLFSIAALVRCTSTPGPRAAGGASAADGIPTVRVCLSEGHSTARIFFAKDAFLIGSPKNTSIKADDVYECSISPAGRIVVSNSAGVLAEFDGTLRCWHPDPKQRFGFEGNRYSDTLLLAADGAKLIVVNVLPIERYLESVVPNEIGRNLTEDAFAAAAAQAIIARTYAMRRIDLPMKKLFHLHDDTRDQVFSGMMHRTRLASRAVRETTGRVLIDGQRYAECYYHAVCGGHTESVGGAWPGHEPRSYLAGIADAGGQGDYCRAASSYRWSESYTRQELERILAAFIPSAADEKTAASLKGRTQLLDIKITERTASGRVHELQLFIGTPSDHIRVVLRGDKIRWALRRPGGERILRSTLFDVALERDAQNWITSIRIDGGGNGHGVGLCQTGAIERALGKAGIEMILQAYYPGTETMRLYEGN